MATYLIYHGANQISPNTLVRGPNANSQVNVTWQFNSTEVQIQSYLTYSVATEAIWNNDIDTSAYAHFYIKGRGSSSAAAQSFSVNDSSKNITESTDTYKWNISAATSNVALYCRRTASGGVNAYVYVTDMWMTKDVTLTYDANNGSGAPSAVTKEEGTTFNLSSTTPTWSGHTFLGWATSSTATTAAYAAGASYTMPTNGTTSVTLFAVWRTDSYTVSISAAKGTTITFDGVTYTNTTTTVTKAAGSQCAYTIKRNAGYVIKTRSPASDGSMTINSNKSLSATATETGCRLYSSGQFRHYAAYIWNSSLSKWEEYRAYIYYSGDWHPVY